MEGAAKRGFDGRLGLAHVWPLPSSESSQPPDLESHEFENCLRRSTASEDSVESASLHIGRSAAAIRTASPGRSRHSAEFEALVDYAQENGLILPVGSVPESPLDHGQEHVVWSSSDGQRVFKATYPNKFGFTIGAHPDATPLQYFERLALTNKLFGDDLRFEGLSLAKGKVQVVTSQSWIKGEAADPSDVQSFMEALGLQALVIDGQGCWYSKEMGILAFDAHTRNFVSTKDGIVPIDVNVVLLEGEIAAQIAVATDSPPH